MFKIHQRFPWIVSIGSAVLFLAVALAGTPIGNSIEMSAGLPVNSGILIQQLLLVMLSALLVTLLGGWRKAGFFKPIQWKALLYAVPPLIGPIFLLFMSGFAETNPLQIIMLVIFITMIGFAEEALCRGMILQAFMPRGPMQAAVFSSLIFGSMHLIQVFYGMPVTTALLYVVYAGLIGFGFAAPYIKGGGAIWPLIIVHGLYDLLGKLGHSWGAQAQPTSTFEIVVRLGLAVLVGMYGFRLLKQKSHVPAPIAPDVNFNHACAGFPYPCYALVYGYNTGRATIST